MKIGLVPMAAKPYHAGHDALVRLASSECDAVQLFVSVTDRSRPGEMTIRGDDMYSLWKKHIEHSLPGNCMPPIYTKSTSPIRELFEFLIGQEREGSDDTFAIYSDSEDIKLYSPDKLMRYAPSLYAAGQVVTRGIDRSETVPVSGTKMREFLSSGDASSFSKFLPPSLQAHSQEIVDLLTRKPTNESAITEVSAGRRADALAKRILIALIQELKSPETFSLISNKKPAQVIVTADEMGIPPGTIDYVQLDFNFNPQLDMQDIATNAAFIKSKFAPRIEVMISYPDRHFRIKDIADIYPELLENIRHELEHTTQAFDKNSESSPKSLNTLNDFVKYFLDDTEVSAYTAGLMSKAKSRRVPLSRIIDDKVDSILVDAEDAGIDDDDVEKLGDKLRDTYTKYARARYPKMM